jgi:hypothetical protein
MSLLRNVSVWGLVFIAFSLMIMSSLIAMTGRDYIGKVAVTSIVSNLREVGLILLGTAILAWILMTIFKALRIV